MKAISATPRRKQAILRTALDLFTEHGFEATSIADLCERSGASVGSLYHHFDNKQAIAAELYLEGVRSVQKATIERLLGCTSAEAGVRWLAESYLSWCEVNPRYAAFLLAHRRSSFMVITEAQLHEVNRTFLVVVKSWARPFIEAGELPDISPELYAALLIGPSEQIARNWVRRGSKSEIASLRPLLATASWHGIRGLCMPQARNNS